MTLDRQPQAITGPFGELLVAPDTGGRSAPHFHSTFAIGVGRSGSGSVFARGRQWTYSSDMIVATNPFDPHWGRPAPGGVRYSLLYPCPLWLRGLIGCPPLQFERAVIADAETANRLKLAFDRILDVGDDGLIAEAVLDLFRRHATLEADPAAEAAVAVDIDRSIADLASAAGLSRAYHSRSYRRRTGLSPLDHRRQARVLGAKSMIEAGVALAAAAAAVGFADQAHMTRQFRQILGRTPGSCRPNMGHIRSIL